MKPNMRFVRLPKDFWAHVRSISQECGHTVPKKGLIKVPSILEICNALKILDLDWKHISADGRTPTDFGDQIVRYFQYRADVLNKFVEPRLMNAVAAAKLFRKLQKKCLARDNLIPMNKQKGKKKKPAYMTSIVNMLIHEHAAKIGFDHNPMALTTITSGGRPLRTLARRVDGAFPSVVNPIAVWEVKEYYHTTTFGSRVADGVYETLLDGMELEELREHEGIDVKHYLIIDAHYTWWKCGRSYLCRIIDMLHMGYVDEVLFGREVAERLPSLVSEWLSSLRNRNMMPRISGSSGEPTPSGHIPASRS